MLAFLAPTGDAATTRETEQQLKALAEQIEQATRAVTSNALQRNRLTRQLQQTESAAAQARAQLNEVLSDLREHGARRDQLAADRAAQQKALAAERASLANQLRVAYLLGHTEPLKLLLNQQDPLRAGRLFSYYGYFSRARARQVEAIDAKLHALQELDAQRAAEESELAALRDRRSERLQAVEQQRDQRKQVLVSLQQEARTRDKQLQQLKAQQADLQELLKRLRQALRRLPPPDTDTAFGKLRGRLDWPVNGRLVARYGDQHLASVKWDGMVVATERGAPVRAIAPGRVAYADWLSGLGNLVIIDHGSNYMSVYGFNDQLQRRVGEQVAAGDVIAAAGDSGGRSRPELYFGLVRGGTAIDPLPWFRTSTPPAR